MQHWLTFCGRFDYQPIRIRKKIESVFEFGGFTQAWIDFVTELSKFSVFWVNVFIIQKATAVIILKYNKMFVSTMLGEIFKLFTVITHTNLVSFVEQNVLAWLNSLTPLRRLFHLIQNWQDFLLDQRSIIKKKNVASGVYLRCMQPGLCSRFYPC